MIVLQFRFAEADCDSIRIGIYPHPHFVMNNTMSPKKRTLRYGFATLALGLMMLTQSVNHEMLADQSTQPSEWIEMFNGQDLTGWVAEGVKEYNDNDNQVKPVWTVKDGLLRCDGNGFGFLRYDTEVTDFVYHVEFRMGKQCNSGLGIRHVKYEVSKSTATRPSYSGYEIQILDDEKSEPSKTSTASLYRYVAPTANSVKAAGEWNTIDIECRGPKIRITLNDKLVQDVDQTQVEEIRNKPLHGYVSVQNHGKLIEFRNLKLKKMANK